MRRFVTLVRSTSRRTLGTSRFLISRCSIQELAMTMMIKARDKDRARVPKVSQASLLRSKRKETKARKWFGICKILRSSSMLRKSRRHSC